MNIIVYDTEEKNRVVISEYIRESLPESTVTMFSKIEDLRRYAEKETVHVAFLNIDEAGGRGFFLAKEFRGRYPRMNLIFISEQSGNLEESFDLRISGYIGHIPSKEDVRKELMDLRYNDESYIGSI